LEDILTEKRNKIAFNKTSYKKAIFNNDIEKLNFLYHNDTRNKYLILAELFQILDTEERDFFTGKKNIFIDKVNNGEITIPIDNYFRSNLDTNNVALLTNISLAHLNVESDGSINKTFISYSQQYIKHQSRYFIINIIFFIGQIDLKKGENDYSFFIVRDNFKDPEFLKGLSSFIGANLIGLLSFI